jgi:hypothetical protein
MSSFYLSQLTFCLRSRHLARNPPKHSFQSSISKFLKNIYAAFLFISIMLCKKDVFQLLE